MPTASFLGFLATMVSLTVSYGLSAVRPLMLNGEEFIMDYGLMSIVFVMAFRHQIRVIFLDALYFDHCNSVTDWRTEFWLLLIVAALGGLTLTIFYYGKTVMSAFMLLYCFFFLLFGLSVYRKIYSSLTPELGKSISDWDTYPRSYVAVAASLFVDIVLVLSWSFISFALIFKDLSMTDIEGVSFLVLTVFIILISEYILVFNTPVLRQMMQAKRLLITKNG